MLLCYGLCFCCAFSAVLSGYGHSLPCEAWKENVSHGVIMSNPPPHTQPTFSPPHPPPPNGNPTRTIFFLYLSTIRKQDFLFSLLCWTMTLQKTFRHVWLSGIVDVIVQFVTWLPFFSYSCRVIGEISFGWCGIQWCYSLFMQLTRALLEYTHIGRKHTVGACGQDVFSRLL